MAMAWFRWNQAPADSSVRYMEVEEGRKAVAEMNIPGLNNKRAMLILATLGPISFWIPLTK